MEIPTGLLKLVGVIAGSMMTVYYIFSLVSATVANWTIYKTLPNEMKKQTEILEKILAEVEKREM